MAASVSRMVELIEWYCGTANLGYDQWNRWDFPEPGDATTPGECDCSSLVYHCAELAGFDVPKSGTRYTGTMMRDFTKAGFAWVADTSTGNWQAGDILYKDGHTAIWTGKYIAEAYGDESGGSHGGASGDQGNETRLSPKRSGWLGYFRYPEVKPGPVWPSNPEGVSMDWIVEEGSNNVAHTNDQQAWMVRWTKYASGLMTATVSDYFNGGNGKRYEGQYYLDKTLELPEGFIEPPIITGLSIRASSGWVTVQVHTIKPDSIGFWPFGTKKAIPRFSLDVKVEGLWK